VRPLAARIALLLWAGGTLCVATTAGFASTHRAVSGFFHRTLGLDAEVADAWTSAVRKSFHVPAYALLAALAWWALPAGRRRWTSVLAFALLVAGADEVLQAVRPGRTGRVTDVLVDLGGALLGLFLVGAFRRRTPAGGGGEIRSCGSGASRA
jgi:hypothetical protein